MASLDNIVAKEMEAAKTATPRAHPPPRRPSTNAGTGAPRRPSANTGSTGGAAWESTADRIARESDARDRGVGVDDKTLVARQSEMSDLRKQVASALDEERKGLAKRAKELASVKANSQSSRRKNSSTSTRSAAASRACRNASPRRRPTQNVKGGLRGRRGDGVEARGGEKGIARAPRDDGAVLGETQGGQAQGAPRRDGGPGCWLST